MASDDGRRYILNSLERRIQAALVKYHTKYPMEPLLSLPSSSLADIVKKQDPHFQRHKKSALEKMLQRVIREVRATKLIVDSSM